MPDWPVLREFERAGHQLHRTPDGPLRDRERNRLAMALREGGLRIEQIHLARSAAHVKEDDVAGARRKVRGLGKQIEELPVRLLRSDCFAGKQPAASNASEAATELRQHLATSQATDARNVTAGAHSARNWRLVAGLSGWRRGALRIHTSELYHNFGLSLVLFMPFAETPQSNFSHRFQRTRSWVSSSSFIPCTR